MTPITPVARAVSDGAARSRRPLWIAAATALGLVLAVVLMWQIDPVGAFFAAGASVVVVVGLFVPHRATLGFGVVVLVVSTLVATAGRSTGESVAVHALFASIAIGVLVAGDLSFGARRSSHLSQPTVERFVGSHIAAALGGIVLSAATVAAVLLIEWPRWMLLVPAVALPVGTLALVIVVNRYQRNLNLVPQAPAPTGAPVARSGRPGPMPVPPRPRDRA